MPRQLYWLCSGSSRGVTTCVTEGDWSSCWPFLNLHVWNFRNSCQVQIEPKRSCSILIDVITMCSSMCSRCFALHNWGPNCLWRRPVTTQSRGLFQPLDVLEDTKHSMASPNLGTQTHRWQIKQQFTFNTDIYRWTEVWKEDESGSSSSFALIWSSVFHQNRMDG